MSDRRSSNRNRPTPGGQAAATSSNPYEDRRRWWLFRRRYQEQIFDHGDRQEAEIERIKTLLAMVTERTVQRAEAVGEASEELQGQLSKTLEQSQKNLEAEILKHLKNAARNTVGQTAKTIGEVLKGIQLRLSDALKRSEAATLDADALKLLASEAENAGQQAVRSVDKISGTMLQLRERQDQVEAAIETIEEELKREQQSLTERARKTIELVKEQSRLSQEAVDQTALAAQESLESRTDKFLRISETAGAVLNAAEDAAAERRPNGGVRPDNVQLKLAGSEAAFEPAPSSSVVQKATTAGNFEAAEPPEVDKSLGQEVSEGQTKDLTVAETPSTLTHLVLHFLKSRHRWEGVALGASFVFLGFLLYGWLGPEEAPDGPNPPGGPIVREPIAAQTVSDSSVRNALVLDLDSGQLLARVGSETRTLPDLSQVTAADHFKIRLAAQLTTDPPSDKFICALAQKVVSIKETMTVDAFCKDDGTTDIKLGKLFECSDLTSPTFAQLQRCAISSHLNLEGPFDGTSPFSQLKDWTRQQSWDALQLFVQTGKALDDRITDQPNRSASAKGVRNELTKLLPADRPGAEPMEEMTVQERLARIQAILVGITGEDRNRALDFLESATAAPQPPPSP